jgi:hypothetical protein
MAHAVALHRARLPEADLEKWIEEVATTQLSAVALAARLRPPSRPARAAAPSTASRRSPAATSVSAKRAIWRRGAALIARGEGAELGRP